MIYVVICVCKDDNDNIASIGGIHNGHAYQFDRAIVVDMINKGDRFFTSSNGQSAEVKVYDQVKKFIKTWADGEWNDNLDNLRHCPNCQ